MMAKIFHSRLREATREDIQREFLKTEESPVTSNWAWPKNGFLTRRRAELAAKEAQDE